MKKFKDLKIGEVIELWGALYKVVGFINRCVQLECIGCRVKNTGWKNSSIVKYLNSLTPEHIVKSWQNGRMD